MQSFLCSFLNCTSYKLSTHCWILSEWWTAWDWNAALHHLWLGDEIKLDHSLQLRSRSLDVEPHDQQCSAWLSSQTEMSNAQMLHPFSLCSSATQVALPYVPISFKWQLLENWVFETLWHLIVSLALFMLMMWGFMCLDARLTYKGQTVIIVYSSVEIK